MATMAKSKTADKGDIRRLMKESKTKINSPLAKYNGSGQLTCILCECVVKNELVWPAHLNGRQHKEKVATLKSGMKPVAATTTKRKHGVVGTLPSDFFEGGSAPKQAKNHCNNSSLVPEKLKIIPLKERKPAGILKNKITMPPPETITAQAAKSVSAIIAVATSTKSTLASDFLQQDEQIKSEPNDSFLKVEVKTEVKSETKESKKKKDNVLKEEEPRSTSPSQDLPEGFFDDPVEDAKVHQKEYVDPLDAEWEKFQKEIKMEAHKSDVILEENEDVMIFKRTLAEIDDQIEGWAKVEALHVKKEKRFVKFETKEEIKLEDELYGAEGDNEVLMGEKIKVEPKDWKDYGNADEGSDSSDDDDDDDLLDWRSKGT